MPTFSADISGNNARIIYDSASMSTFIASNSLKKFKYNVEKKKCSS